MSEMSVLGVILSGGRSSRMGRDKAAVKLGTKTLLEHAYTQLNHCLKNMIISTNIPTEIHYSLSLPLLPDRSDLRWEGPLSGILSSLLYAKEHGFDYILTVPIDTPFLTHPFFQTLLSDIKGTDTFRLASSHNGLEPTLGLWPITKIQLLQYYLKTSNNRSIRSFAMSHDVEIIAFDHNYKQDAFLNINTPDELTLAHEKIRHLKDQNYDT